MSTHLISLPSCQLKLMDNTFVNPKKLQVNPILKADPHPIINQKEPKKGIKKPNVIKVLSKGILFSIPVVILRITALFISIFGIKGKKLAEKIEYNARKIDTIYVIHNFIKINSLSPTSHIICRINNLGTKKSIKTEEDLRKSNEFLELLRNPNYQTEKKLPELAPELKSMLHSFSVKGAKNKGICFGASLHLIKKFLSNEIRTEEELINLLKPYEKGFPAEASALQNALEAFQIKKLKTVYLDRVRQLKKQGLKPIKNFSNIDAKSMEEINQDRILIKKQLDEIKIKIQSIKNEISRYTENRHHYVASLIDLKVNRKIDSNDIEIFHGSIHQEEAQILFNRIGEGYYLFDFSLGTSRHAMIYIKKEFGSYFIDSNQGLIRCTTLDPAKELYEYLKKYYPCKNKDKALQQTISVFNYRAL